MKIVHHHANGRFDWLISEHQSVNPSREGIAILFRKYKGFTLSILWYLIPLYRVVVQCMRKVDDLSLTYKRPVLFMQNPKSNTVSKVVKICLIFKLLIEKNREEGFKSRSQGL